MKYQKLLSLTRQAVDTYQMINEGCLLYTSRCV